MSTSSTPTPATSYAVRLYGMDAKGGRVIACTDDTDLAVTLEDCKRRGITISAAEFRPYIRGNVS